jgi:hypothetical protein
MNASTTVRLHLGQVLILRGLAALQERVAAAVQVHYRGLPVGQVRAPAMGSQEQGLLGPTTSGAAAAEMLP